MKATFALASALIVGLCTIGCGPSATTVKKTETTTTTPEGEMKTTIEQKVETTPESTTRTTTEKVEKSRENSSRTYP